MVRIERVTLATRGVTALLEAIHKRYGGETDVSAEGELRGAYDARGLIAVMGWADGPAFRFITEWATVGGRRGLRGSAALMRLARTRKLVGLVALANEDARAWVKANGGREEAVFMSLPEA